MLRAAAIGISLVSTAELIKFLKQDNVYSDAVQLITQEINYVQCKESAKTKGLSISCDVYVPSVYSYERVKTILNTYIQIVLNQPNIPEFDASSPEAVRNSEITIQAVRQKSGEPDDKTVRLVLNQMYWSTVQNRVKDTAFIKPRTARDNAMYRETPQEYKKEDKGFFDKLQDTLGTVGMVVIGGTVVVGGVVLYNTFKEN